MVYMVVDTQRATESSAAARADRIRKTDSLSMGRVKRTGKRSMKRAMHEPAVRASRSVIEFGEPAVRELSGWANVSARGQQLGGAKRDYGEGSPSGSSVACRAAVEGSAVASRRESTRSRRALWAEAESS